MEDIYIVDAQFFRGDNKELILKCLSYSKIYSDIFEQFIFKPPYNINQLSPFRRREVKFVTKTIHHINWDDGFVEYNEIKYILKNKLGSAREILVKGLEKATFLDSILERKLCYNIENLNCPNLKSLKDKISGFPLEDVCTLNVKVLKSFMKTILQHSSEYINNSVEKYTNVGLFSLSDSDIYFLPVSLLVKSCPVELLKSYYYKFPPHIRQDETFENFVRSNLC